MMKFRISMFWCGHSYMGPFGPLARFFWSDPLLFLSCNLVEKRNEMIS